jgi:hypothetical protein
MRVVLVLAPWLAIACAWLVNMGLASGHVSDMWTLARLPGLVIGVARHALTHSMPAVPTESLDPTFTFR